MFVECTVICLDTKQTFRENWDGNTAKEDGGLLMVVEDGGLPDERLAPSEERYQ